MSSADDRTGADGAAFDRITDRWAMNVNDHDYFLCHPDTFRVRNFFSFMVGFDLRCRLRLHWRYSDRFVYDGCLVENLSNVSTDFTFAFQLGFQWDRTREPEAP